MRGKLITIFGGNGFVGRNLIPKLTETGAMVRVAVRNADEAISLKTSGYVGQVELLPVNISKSESLEKAIAGSDYVVNLIGIIHERRKGDFTRLHVDLPRQIATLASQHKIQRLVHVSALGADRDSASKYAASKGLGEVEAMKAYPQSTILRPSIIFGPEDMFINRFAGMAHDSPIFPLIGGGKTKLQPVYVGDVAEAIRRTLKDTIAGTNPHAGKIYELGGPAIYSMRDLVDYILLQIQKRRLKLPIPYPIAMIMGTILGLLPTPPLTRDQVRLLRKDNVVTEGALTFKDLHIEPVAMEAIVPSYLGH